MSSVVTQATEDDSEDGGAQGAFLGRANMFAFLQASANGRGCAEIGGCGQNFFEFFFKLEFVLKAVCKRGRDDNDEKTKKTIRKR